MKSSSPFLKITSCNPRKPNLVKDARLQLVIDRWLSSLWLKVLICFSNQNLLASVSFKERAFRARSIRLGHRLLRWFTHSRLRQGQIRAGLPSVRRVRINQEAGECFRRSSNIAFLPPSRIIQTYAKSTKSQSAMGINAYLGTSTRFSDDPGFGGCRWSELPCFPARSNGGD